MSVLEFNSLAFGIDLGDSSSDSSEDFTAFRTNKPKMKWKNTERMQKRKSQHKNEDKLRKKLHENGEPYYHD